MINALEDANIKPEDVTYINAHGTSTPLNDKGETMAIKTALKDAANSVAVSSTKGNTGHCLGAAGGIEGVICVKAIEEGFIPPSINYTTPDPLCDLDLSLIHIYNIPCTVIGHLKGRTLEENLKCNFGMSSPEGYRCLLYTSRCV